MIRHSVDSDNVSSVGYDKSTTTLEVEFNSGGLYQYHGVPETEYYNLINSDSVGSYLHRNIKRYPFTRLR